MMIFFSIISLFQHPVTAHSLRDEISVSKNQYLCKPISLCQKKKKKSWQRMFVTKCFILESAHRKCCCIPSALTWPSRRQPSRFSSRRITSVPRSAQRLSQPPFLLASLSRTSAPPPGVPPERSPREERHGRRGGWRDAGDGRRRSDAEPAEEQSQAEKAKGVVRRPDVLCGGTAGARRGAPGSGTESRWAALWIIPVYLAKKPKLSVEFMRITSCQYVIIRTWTWI